ncbi:MAG TPA: hypothetical protein VGJ41_13145 [Nocardioides sp.]|jgi:hypothetical protein
MSPPRSKAPDVSPSASFAVALKAAIADRGLALGRIRAHLSEAGLRVGVATLSTWQSGQRQPRAESRAVVVALEELLELPEGWLTLRLPDAESAQARRHKPYGNLVEYGDTLAELLEEVRRDAYGRMRSVTIVEELKLGADRSMVSRNVVQTLRAAAEADRHIVVHRGEDGSKPGLITLSSIAGCRPGRIARDESTGAVLGELLYDRTLAVGETAVVRYQFEDGNGIPSDYYYRFEERTGPHYVLEIEFHPEAMPVRVWEFRRRQYDQPDVVRRELMSRDRRVHIVVPRVERGVVGIAWEWD